MTTRSRIVRGLLASAAALCASALSASATTAGAQFRAAQALQRPVEPMVGAGGSLALDRAGNALGNGLNVLAGLTLHSGALPFGVRVAVSGQHFPAQTGRVDRTTTVTGGFAQLLGAHLGATLGVPTGVVRPYAVAGVGYYGFRSRRNVEQAVAGNATTFTPVRQSETAWGVSGGVGVRGGVYGLKVFVEARLDDVFTGDGGAFGATQLRVIPVTAGFAF